MWTWMPALLGSFAGHLEPMAAFAKDHVPLMRFLHLLTNFGDCGLGQVDITQFRAYNIEVGKLVWFG